MIALIGMAVRNLVQGGRRNVFLAVALALITVAIVMASALFRGVTDRMITYGQGMRSGDINVIGAVRDFAGRTSEVLEDAERVERCLKQWRPDIDIVPRIEGEARIFRGTASVRLSINGLHPDREDRFWRLLRNHGAAMRRPDEILGRGDVILFERHAKALDAQLGDTVTVWVQSDRGAYNTVKLRVWGIVNDMPIADAYAHFETVRELLQRPPGATTIAMVYVPGIKKRNLSSLVPSVIEKLRGAGLDVVPLVSARSAAIRKEMLRADWRGARYAVNAAPNELKGMWWRWAAVDGITTLLALILGLIAAIGVTNVLLVSVKQRTREIGTLRALGMSRTKVALLLLGAGLSRGAMAGGGGALRAGRLCWVFNRLSLRVGSEAFRLVYFTDVVSFYIGLDSLLMTAIALTAVTAAACVWPAWRAARWAPAVALREAA